MDGLNSPLVSPLRRRQFLTGGLALAGGVALSACGGMPDRQSHGLAFTDPLIPPGLPPQYYPPRGFVWSGLEVGNLPQARYGVAAPPVNPHGHMLILADSAHPAEVYFDLAQSLSLLGLSVWLFEAPGQGGAGRYIPKARHVDVADFRHAPRCATSLITHIIRPAPPKPLYVFGHGSGALTAMQLQTGGIEHMWLYGVWNGPDKPDPRVWSGDSLPEDDWGRIAHRWQTANPDLRLTGVTQRWLTEVTKARKAALAFRPTVPVDWLEGGLSAGHGRSLCSEHPTCRFTVINGREALKSYLASRLMA